MIYCGIDNGLDGGVAQIDWDGSLIMTDVMPTTRLGKGREVDVMALRFLLPPVSGSMVLVEEASKHSAGVLALTSTWFTYGHIIAMLKILGYRYETVNPRAWQKIYWSKPKMPKGRKYDTKAAALSQATKLWPSQDWTPTEKSKKPHDGIVDAALIAEYARRKNL